MKHSRTILFALLAIAFLLSAGPHLVGAATVQLPAGGDVVAAANALPAGDTLLLPRGAVFKIAAGRNITLRDGVTLSEYGERDAGGNPKLPRPELVFTGDKPGLVIAGVRGVRVVSVQVTAAGGGKHPGVQLKDAADITIENCVVAGWRFNVVAHRTVGVNVRGCLIERSWTADAGKYGHSSGIYVYGVDGLLIDRCAFVRNGLSPAGGRSIYNHGVYIAASCGPATVRDSTFIANSSHGVQMRSGGDCGGNLFVDNPIGLSHGVVNGSAIKPGGVAGTVERNVFIGGNPIDEAKRGYAAEVGNAAGTVLRENLAAHDSQRHDAPFLINPCRNVTNGPAVSPSRVEIDGLYAYQWPGHPERNGVLRVATPATGARDRIATIATTPVDLRKLLGDVEVAARRDPWTCAPTAIPKARRALNLEPVPEDPAVTAAKARIAAIDSELAALALTMTTLRGQIEARQAERAALVSQLSQTETSPQEKRGSS